MAVSDIDFGSGNNINDSNNNDINFDNNQTDDQNKNTDDNKNNNTDDNQNNDKNLDNNNIDNKNNNNNKDNKTEDDKYSFIGELKPGDSIDFEDNVYTVAENGDLVDKEGKVFKTASELKDWLATLEVPEDNEINVDSIKEAIGQDIVDDNGKPIEYPNTIDGIKDYFNAVIEQKTRDVEEAAINTLYANNPLLKQFKDYVDVTGTYEGFGQLPNREYWEVNKDNEAQQEAIIRMAASEFGNKAINDSYIQYLKDSGSLYNVAVEQLDALKDKDEQLRDNIRAQAEENRRLQQEEVTAYWNKVNNIIKSRTIAGYKLPNSITKEINGKKQILTPDDFYNYLSKQTYTNADGQKISAYQKDLEEKSDDEFINNELINAWLMFTGGSFKDLAEMAIKENEVRKLKLVSKQHKTTSSIRVNKKTPSKLNPDDIVF